MSFSATAILGAFAAQLGVHGEKATYRIGDVSIPDLDVIPGKTEADTLSSDGLATTTTLQDFQLRAADLVLPSGQQFIPDRGHIIEVTRGDQVQYFVVSHPDANQAPYRRADAYGAVLRVHTLEQDLPTPAPTEE